MVKPMPKRQYPKGYLKVKKKIAKGLGDMFAS